MLGQQGHEAFELTFVPSDPPRDSWFALWTPGATGALLDGVEMDGGVGQDDGLERVDIELYVRSKHAGVQRRMVAVRKLSLETAIALLVELPAAAPVRASTRAWSAVVRSALGLLARGRALPWVSPQGWDSWRVDPLDASDLEHADALGAALPAEAHAIPSDAADGAIVEPGYAIRACYDACADRLIRTAAARVVAGVDPFASASATRVRHLRPWVESVAVPHCLGSGLVVRVHPPEPTDDGDEGGWRLQFQLRSRRDVSLVVNASELWTPGSEMGALLGDRAELELLVGLQRAVDVCHVLAPALDDAHPTEILLDDDALDELLDRLEELAAVGVDVRWPSDLVAPHIERRLVVSAGGPSDESPSFADLASLLEVDWEFLLDGLALTASELTLLAAAKRAVVPLRGRWVRMAPSDRRRLAEPVPELSVAQVVAVVLGGDSAGLLVDGLGSELRVEGAVAQLLQRITDLENEREAPEPIGLKAELRSYQRRGLAWLSDLAASGLGGCLADDMGLGKTVQVLALHAARGGSTLVVCPTSLMANWEREAARFVPDANVIRYHGPNRKLPTPQPGDIVVTTYGVVRSDAESLGSLGWDLVVADEAQNVKNPRSRTARAVRHLHGNSRIALTGTPVENRLSELWAIMDWVVPGLLGSLETFRHSLAIPIERDADPASTARLARLLGPFLLRRRKTDPGIAPELPPKTERDVNVQLTAEQVTLYKATTAEVLDEISLKDGINRRGLVLKLLTALKQIANHPAHYLGEPGPTAGRSGKLATADELLDLAALGGESTLVFTQYVAMGKLLVRHLTERGLGTELLHGGMTVGARQDLVDRFQARELSVLVLSLKAGGTGLNLTAATQVIHYDRWWNPAVEDQATDRAYRIGQDAPVTVHRLIAAGTVEDRVAQLLAAKRDLADRVVSGGEAWIGELDDDALAELVLFDDGADTEGAT